MASNYWLDTNGDWTNTANWSTGSVPATGDTVYILSGAQQIITNLNQSSVTLAALYIGQGFTGAIGSASAYLQIGATLCYIGVPITGPSQGNGSGRVKIDFGSVQTAVLVQNTSNSTTDAGLEPVRLIGTNASNAINVLSGTVGIGTTYPTESTTVATVGVTGGTVNLGFGVSWTTANVSTGGRINTNTAGTTLTVGSGGTATTNGSVAITTVNVTGTANLNHRASTMSTTINVFAGNCNFSGNPATSTVTTLNFYGGSQVNVSPANPTHITFTNLVIKAGGSLSLN